MGKHYNRRELIEIARDRGWTILDSRGKGSHALAVKEGERPFPIPQKISPKVYHEIKKRLGIQD